jgi:XTP/dITP diphosphohydrolase
MKRELLFATTNQGKLAEARACAAAFPVSLIGLGDAAARGLTAIPEVAEDGVSYHENAAIKARAYAAWSGLDVIADDTGLEVAALGGAPGLFSARYAGIGVEPSAHRERLLSELIGVQDRRARFVCVLGLHVGTDLQYFEGTLEGTIADVERGHGGFGYDPLFKVTGTGHTLAELKLAGHAVVTHRIAALQALLAAIC